MQRKWVQATAAEMAKSGAFLAVTLVMLSSLCMYVDSKPQAAVNVLEHIHVDILNRLGDKLVLWVHCKSKDDDLGDHFVNDGELYTFSFYVNYWGTTLFFCSVKYEGRPMLQFDVYKYTRDRHRCNYMCSWRMNQDGVYGFNEETAQWEFMYPWPQPI